MTVDSPEADEHNYYDQYWRCGRNGGCGQKAGWGTDHVGVGACKLHGGNNPRGEDHPQYEHGAYSKYLGEDSFTDEERERAEAIFEDLQDLEGAQDVGRAFAMDLFIRYERARDPRFAREFRQFCETFGFAPEDIQRLLVEHSGSVEHDHDLTPDEKHRLDRLLATGDEVTVELDEEATPDA